MISMCNSEKIRSCFVQLRPDGIVEVRSEDNHTCTVDSARITTATIAALAAGKPVPVLRIAGAHTQIDYGVREYMASDESQVNILAEAIVVRSLAQRLIGNFYLKNNRPRKPTKLFDDITKAEEWLKMQVKLHLINLS